MVSTPCGRGSRPPSYLKALDDDVEAHPAQIKLLDLTILQRVQDLVRGVEIDLEATLLVGTSEMVGTRRSQYSEDVLVAMTDLPSG